jgi:hypothetical protein
MSYRLSYPAFRVWKRLGYHLTDPWPHLQSAFAGIHAEAPGCTAYRLKLTLAWGEIAVVSLERAPVKPKRLWQEVTELRDFEGWNRVPAAWFARMVESLLAAKSPATPDPGRGARASRRRSRPPARRKSRASQSTSTEVI